jgi:hypothetical protein
LENASYRFHGTMTKVGNGFVFAYSDTFNFEVDEGGKTGEGQLYIYGEFQVVK